MSLNKIFVILSVSSGSFFSYYFFNKTNTQHAFHAVPQSEFSGYGVIDRVIQLKFMEATASKTETIPATIKVAVTLPFDFNQVLHFKWLLTENIKMLSGDVSGDISNFKAGVPREIEIQVTGFSRLENRQVAFQIAGFKEGRKMFADGIVASLKENTFENIVQNVEKIKTEREQE